MKKILLAFLTCLSLVTLMGCGVNLDDYVVAVKVTDNSYTVGGVINDGVFKAIGMQKLVNDLNEELKNEGVEANISVKIEDTDIMTTVYAASTNITSLINKLNDNEVPIYKVIMSYTKDNDTISSEAYVMKVKDITKYKVEVVHVSLEDLK